MKIIQLGANKGHDHLTEYLNASSLELELGIFVEPNQLHLEELKECYSAFPNAIIENIAIKTSDMEGDELTIYYYELDGPAFAVASTDPQHIKKHYGDVVLDSFIVPCITLDELFKKYELKEIDWLLIDVEGLDAQIALDFDWDSYTIKRVDIENLHLGEDSERVRSIFTSRGYQEINSTNGFDWAFAKLD
jgi:FkbM family methyltransferase